MKFSGKGAQAFSGMGDVVEAAASITGLKRLAESYSNATGRDCGCSKRRDKLNEVIPFRRRSDDLQRDENPAQ